MMYHFYPIDLCGTPIARRLPLVLRSSMIYRVSQFDSIGPTQFDVIDLCADSYAHMLLEKTKETKKEKKERQKKKKKKKQKKKRKKKKKRKRKKTTTKTTTTLTPTQAPVPTPARATKTMATSSMTTANVPLCTKAKRRAS